MRCFGRVTSPSRGCSVCALFSPSKSPHLARRRCPQSRTKSLSDFTPVCWLFLHPFYQCVNCPKFKDRHCDPVPPGLKRRLLDIPRLRGRVLKDIEYFRLSPAQAMAAVSTPPSVCLRNSLLCDCTGSLDHRPLDVRVCQGNSSVYSVPGIKLLQIGEAFRSRTTSPHSPPPPET